MTTSLTEFEGDLDEGTPPSLNPVPGFIYLIHAVGTKRYKIGFSSDINRRLLQLSRQSAFPLAVVAYHSTNDMAQDEEAWHKLFEDARVHGEWFELSDDYVWLFTSSVNDRGIGSPSTPTNDPEAWRGEF